MHPVRTNFYDFSEAGFLRQLSPGVNRRWLQGLAISNNLYFEPGFVTEADLLEPLASHRFPTGDLTRFGPLFDFVLMCHQPPDRGNPDFLETTARPDTVSWVYLTAVHLYAEWLAPHGMNNSSFFIGRCLDGLSRDHDLALAILFLQYLGWITHVVEGHANRRSYFIILALIILCRMTGFSGIDEAGLKLRLEEELRHGCRTTITDSQSCCETWPALLARIGDEGGVDLDDLACYLPLPFPY